MFCKACTNKTIGWATLRTTLVTSLTTVLVSCGTGQTYDAGASTKRIVGTDLIATKGATADDQRKIDRTIVGLCSTKVYTSAECNRHWVATSP